MTSVPPPTLPERPQPGAPPPPAPPVALWLPFAVLAGAIMLIALFGVAVVGLATAVDPSIDAAHPPDSFTIGLTVVQDIVFVVAAYVAVRAAQGGRASLREFGLVRVSVRRALPVMAVAYVAFWIGTGVLLAIFGSPPEQDIVRDLKHQDAFAVLAGYAVLTCVLAPVAEEFFFRGFMFSVFTRRLGPLWAALVTGVVFGLVHAFGSPLLGVAVLALFGVALCAVAWRLGSIIPCMALHALHNSISFASTKSLSPVGFVALAAASVSLIVAAGGVVARPAAAR